MPRPKVDHTDTICCICKSNKTYMDGYKPVWYTCKCGNKDCKGYICYECKLKEKREEYSIIRKKIKVCRNTPIYLKELRCCKCGKTGDYKSIQYFCYDKKGDWDGRSRLCRNCYRKIENFDLLQPISEEFIGNNVKNEGVKKGTLVLTDDLRYVPIEKINIGDIIVGLSPDYCFPKFTSSRVLNIFKGKNKVYKIKTNLGDVYSTISHMWLSEHIRWRKTSRFVPGQFLRNISLPIKTPVETKDYKIGYIAGAYEGDGYISNTYQVARLVGDYEMMDVALKYSEELGIGLREAYFNGGIYALDSCIIGSTKSIIKYMREIINRNGNDEYKRGYLSGIYDAEGGWSRNNGLSGGKSSIRIHNTNEKILNKIARYLHHFGFETTLDVFESEGSAIRIVGGLREYINFFVLVNPKAENKKLTIFDYHLRVKRLSFILDIIEENTCDIFNLETTTGNFIANGFVTHDITMARKERI